MVLTATATIVTKREQWLLSRIRAVEGHAEVVVLVRAGVVVRIEKVTGSELPPADS